MTAVCDMVAHALSGGYLRIYDGADVLLAELRFSTPAFGKPRDGVAVSNTMHPDASAKATGYAKRYCCVGADGKCYAEGPVSVGAAGSDEGLRMRAIGIAEGAEVRVSEFRLVSP